MKDIMEAGFLGLRLVAVCKDVAMSGGKQFQGYVFERDMPL